MKVRKECKKYREMIMKDLENGAEIEDYGVLNKHKAECSECRNYYSDMQKYRKLMNSLPVDVPYYIEGKIMANITGIEKPGLSIFPVFNYAVSFAVILIIAVFIMQMPLNNINEKINFVEKKVEHKSVTAVNNKKIKPVVQAMMKEPAKQEIKQEINNKVVAEKKEVQAAAINNNSGGDNIAVNSQAVNKPAQQAYAVNRMQGSVSSTDSKVTAADNNDKGKNCPYGCLLEQQKAIVGNNVINPSKMDAAIIRVKVEENARVKVIIYDKAMRPVSVLMDQDETRDIMKLIGTEEMTVMQQLQMMYILYICR